MSDYRIINPARDESSFADERAAKRLSPRVAAWRGEPGSEKLTTVDVVAAYHEALVTGSWPDL